VARRPKSAPEPTALQLDFIRASEEEAVARLSEQRKQLDAVAAAQAAKETALHDREEALKQAADAQHRRARIRNIALVAISGLAAVAVLVAVFAGQQRMTAEKQRHQADAILARATKIIGNLQYQMDIETKDEAFALFQDGAEHGDATSMTNLGASYHDGRGVTQDYVRAREWFEKAAAKGDTAAMYNLGIIYEEGQGVTQDYAKAGEWYEKAAAKGDARGMYGLGSLYEGVVQDYAKAGEWYEKAAAKGDARGMYGLGTLYEYGRGVTQDYAKARELYEKAVARGEVLALVTLAISYETGQGVTKRDDAKARELYEKATAQGERISAAIHSVAEMGLERLSIHETFLTGRYAEALQREEAFAAKVEANETKFDGKPGPGTARTLGTLTWYALFAKEFTKALTVAERAHALLPDSLAIDVIWAHALMFMAHDEEAKQLYFAHKGDVIRPDKEAIIPDNRSDNKTWERSIADDFADFRKAGLTHPIMADIENELGISR
jgi:TPR repeat protein